MSIMEYISRCKLLRWQAFICPAEDEWEVEKLLAARGQRGKLQHKVKWIGYDDDPPWYNAGNLRKSPVAIRDFHQETKELRLLARMLGKGWGC